MLHRARQVPLYTWLLRLAIFLAVTAVPHVIYVYDTRLPSALAITHVIAAAALFILAEIRHQGHDRIQSAIRLAEITANAEHARQH